MPHVPCNLSQIHPLLSLLLHLHCKYTIFLLHSLFCIHFHDNTHTQNNFSIDQSSYSNLPSTTCRGPCYFRVVESDKTSSSTFFAFILSSILFRKCELCMGVLLLSRTQTYVYSIHEANEQSRYSLALSKSLNKFIVERDYASAEKEEVEYSYEIRNFALFSTVQMEEEIEVCLHE